MTILYDDRGLKVDYFEKLLNTYEKIGIKTSGGVDSTLTLYFVAKFIDELNLNQTHSIQPIFALDQGFTYLGNVEPTLVCFDNSEFYFKIISFIKEKFPLVNIVDPVIIKFSPDRSVKPFSKMAYLKPTIDQLYKDDKIECIISGTTSAPLFENINLGQITKERDYEFFKQTLGRGPFCGVDKKFLAFQYIKENLMDDLYPLTMSCVRPDKPTWEPCKTCDFCKEKYWAFGSYDGGIK